MVDGDELLELSPSTHRRGSVALADRLARFTGSVSMFGQNIDTGPGSRARRSINATAPHEGLEDRAIPPARAIADYRALWPNAPVVEMPGVGHFCQADVPGILVAAIDQFIQANP